MRPRQREFANRDYVATHKSVNYAGGKVAVPQRPGLGVEIDMALVQRVDRATARSYFYGKKEMIWTSE